MYAWQAVIYPMELVRTRLAVSAQGQYKGMADCIQNVLKYEGVRAFYRGLTPSLVGALNLSCQAIPNQYASLKSMESPEP